MTIGRTIDASQRASPTAIISTFRQPQPIAESTNAMNARISRIVLRLRLPSRPPTRSESTHKAKPTAMRFVFLYDQPIEATMRTIRAMISRSSLKLMRHIVGYATYGSKPQPRRQRPHPWRPTQLVAARGAGPGERVHVPAPDGRRHGRRGHRRGRVHGALDGLLPHPGQPRPGHRPARAGHLRR